MSLGAKKTVRIFSYAGNGEYVHKDYKCTALLEEKKADERGGIRRQCEGSVRIMTKEAIDAAVGDYMAFDTERTAPAPQTDFVVCTVKDNRGGRLPHWRLTVNSYDY